MTSDEIPAPGRRHRRQDGFAAAAARRRHYVAARVEHRLDEGPRLTRILTAQLTGLGNP